MFAESARSNGGDVTIGIGLCYIDTSKVISVSGILISLSGVVISVSRIVISVSSIGVSVSGIVISV